MAKGRHEVRAARKRWPLIVGLVAGVLVLALGGGAYATFRYEQANAGRMLAGTTIGGVNVSGMTRAEAIAAVREHAREDLNREIVVVVRGERFIATARQLGQRPWVGQAVDQAMDAAERVGWVERAWRRFRNDPVDLDIELGMAGDRGVAGFVRRTARQVRVDPRNASIGMGEGGGLFFRHAKAGRELEVRRAERLLTQALDDGSSTVRLSVRSVAPKFTEETMLPTVVVHVDTNRLDLYEGFDVTHSWDVATAKPGWTTPVGEWSLYQKRENPTWYNPALDSWGAGMPAVIPGGPGNPMGTRALYITAPGLIRIHGTTSPDSIGRYASHGCIRMHNEQVEELYDLVPVGTKVIIMGSRPSWASEGDFPDTPDGSDTVA
ncbi:MAG TPA: L,D-transpeptidase family protein [Actinomycetota bacterium]|nr:L,D-transpeptidase family protein [Actinomycetota bacterium]